MSEDSGETPSDDSQASSRLRWSVDGLHDLRPALSARRSFTIPQVAGFALAASLLVVGLWRVPVATGITFMAVTTVVYLGMLGMKVEMMIRGGDGRWQFTDEEAWAIPEAELPTYTVLVPAYREPDVLPGLVAHLSALDYPADRMEILLLLEADDDETVNAAVGMDLEPPFRIVLIPPSEPRTKPKALNYAMAEVTGEIVTIYDAEDQPDPVQLRKVVATFRAADESVACVQCELGYFNADENIITRWFATEYRTWFSRFLPQLSKVDAAIPLGGTSNHMRRDVLVGLGAWDPFNVTEDADLGVRLRRQGFRVAVLDSVTLEEANTDFVNWIKQRSRWYKGYLQTWLVHMRHPRALMRDLGVAGFLRFNLFVGGTPGLALINPISWLLLVLWFTLKPKFVLDILPWPVYYPGLIGWLVGNSLYYYINLSVAYELGRRRVFRAALLLPLYWLMMSIAGAKAALQLIFNPSYWEKTTHGLSRVTESDDGPHAGVRPGDFPETFVQPS
jgi:glycosyltransferase XagB